MRTVYFLICLFFCSWASCHNNLIIFTDVLDDDIRAILHILGNEEGRKKLEAVVVTSGNARLKARVVENIIEGFGFKIPVYVGTSSNLLSSNVTSFAGNFEREGVGLVESKELGKLKKEYESRDNKFKENIPKELKKHFIKALAEGRKIDCIVLTAPTDIVGFVRENRNLSKKVMGNLFGMGFYKKRNELLVAPYNTMVDPASVEELFRLFNEGFFENIYHLPSDTIQQRSDLPSGYFPLDHQRRFDLEKSMIDNPLLKAVFYSAREYHLSWQNSALKEIGVGFNDFNRWVPSTFMSASEAIAFYFADTVPVDLALMSERDLFALKAVSRGVTFNSTNLEFKEQREIRKLFDIQRVDGLFVLDRHIKAIEKLSQIMPSKSFLKILGEIRGQRAFHFLPPEIYKRSYNRPLILIFKNSPDDWFGLMNILSDPNGSDALERGGIIVEGFSTVEVAKSVLFMLEEFGFEEKISVASGYGYKENEVEEIPNFTGERALYEMNEGTKAFQKYLPSISDKKITTPQFILDSAFSDNSFVDAVILGEGVDFFEYLNENPALYKKVSSAYIMGGGRLQSSGELKLSRNWLVHTSLILGGIKKLEDSKSKVFVFSSDRFGGSIIAHKAKESIGTGVGTQEGLNLVQGKFLSIKAVVDHTSNWSRVFSWLLGDKGKKAGVNFDPSKEMETISFSPLGVTICDLYMGGEFYGQKMGFNFDKVNINLGQKISYSPAEDMFEGVYWMSHRPYSLPERISKSLGNGLFVISKTKEAKKLHQIVKDNSLFDKSCNENLL